MSWKTDQSSGLLGNFVGTVRDPYFGTDPKYQKGEVVLLQLPCEDVEVTQDGWDGEVEEPHVISFPVGKDWFTEDGQTLEHKKGKTDFHGSTLMGKLIDAIAASHPNYDQLVDEGVLGPVTPNYGTNGTRTDGAPLEVDFGDLCQILMDRGDPTDATVFDGLRFEFAEVLFDYGTNRQTGEAMRSTRAVPVRFVGEDDGSGVKEEPAKPAAKKAPAKKAAAKKAASAAKPAASAAKSKAQEARERAAARKSDGDEPIGDTGEAVNPFTAIDGVDDELAEILLEALTSADDYNAFVDAVVVLPALETNDALLEAVIDDQNGPWADLRGG